MNAEFINAGVFVDNISNVKFIIFHSVMAWRAHKKIICCIFPITHY